METTALTFGSPQWLWLLGILPLVAGIFVWSHRRGRALLAKIVAPRLREQLAGSVSPFRRAARAVLLLGAFAFAILSLAQPRIGFIERETKQKGRDVIIAIDNSLSSLATDVLPTRIDRMKMFSQDLIRLLDGDRIGLVSFAGEGEGSLLAPLTLNHNAVLEALSEVDRDLKDGILTRGSTIAEAIKSARKAFGKSEGNNRALIVLTDGEEHNADSISDAKQARAEGISIFTVGFGSPEGSLIPIPGKNFARENPDDPNSKLVTTKLDEARLEEIAQVGGGQYRKNAPEAAREVFQKGIEPIELAETGVFSTRQPIERFQWPLAAATLCLALSLLPGDRRRRSAKAAAALFLSIAPAAHAQSGLEEYNKGDFQKAATEFQEQLQSRPDSRELQFNAGAAAYKSGDFEAAVKNFTDALLSEDKGLRAKSSYNLANSLVRKGEAAQDPEAKKTNWKNAIEHYGETLEIEPGNKNAEENRDLVKKLLEELEKQQQQQQQQQDQKKDEQKKEDQKQDQQKKDQQQGGSDKKDEQQKQEKEQDKKDGGQDSKPEEKKEDAPKGESGNQNQKDQQKSEGAPKPTPEPAPTPGEKKEGELKGGDGNQPTPTPAPAGQQQEAPAAEEEKEGQMSPAQARALLNSLRSEEEKVNLMDVKRSSPEDPPARYW